jgi:hypothetical protein
MRERVPGIASVRLAPERAREKAPRPCAGSRRHATFYLMSTIHRRRALLRWPALFAAAFWLLSGVADAAQIGACPYHGAAGPGSEEEGLPAPSDPASLHADHAAHAASGAHAGQAISVAANADEAPCDHAHHAVGSHGGSAGHAGDGGHDCDCRSLYCTGTANANPPEPVRESLPATPEAASAVSGPVDMEVRVPSAILPYFLPPSNAPPAF